MLPTLSARTWPVLIWLSCIFPLPGSANPIETIFTDVCIIGGGSSGTYSAIRLQQMGKSVTLIEKENRLGGHVNVYNVPGPNVSFNYGVVVFENISVVTDYFSYLDVPLVRVNSFSSGEEAFYADFANGTLVSPRVLYAGNVTAALIAYQQQLAKYPYLINGFDLPYPVPEDLLLPWGDFMAKYDLGAMAFEIYTYDQGVGNILALPTLYMIKYSHPVQVESLLTGDFLTTPNDNSQELYDSALAQLGTNAYLSSNVTHIQRHGAGVEVLVSTPSGQKLIKASKLIMAIPPLLSNLGFLDLTPQERDVFRQFNNSYYWNAVIKGTGLPDNASVTNVDPAAPYGIPALPGLYSIGTSGFPGLQTGYYSSPYYISDEDVQADILATVARLVQSLGLPAVNATAEFVGFNCHCPFEVQVSTEAIQDGFYSCLEALQGQQNTWWTGAAWQAQDSSYIWNFTEYEILPRVIASL